ncbi:Branched-chain-amino-acid aminotransferase 3 [Spatholobus suberectus]|nr:Branched-chain-amino-acid aminotransferase 3 [Spatholobus suberectus]
MQGAATWRYLAFPLLRVAFLALPPDSSNHAMPRAQEMLFLLLRVALLTMTTRSSNRTLPYADEVFCTGTTVVVSPVGSITYLGKRWKTPKRSFTKLNTDGAVNVVRGRASSGGVIRGHTSSFLWWDSQRVLGFVQSFKPNHEVSNAFV